MIEKIILFVDIPFNNGEIEVFDQLNPVLQNITRERIMVNEIPISKLPSKILQIHDLNYNCFLEKSIIPTNTLIHSFIKTHIITIQPSIYFSLI